MENRKESSRRTTASQGTPPPTSSNNTGLNAPVPGSTRPVLNHPVPTGEEFALKFMWDRMSIVPSTSFPVGARPPAQFPIVPSGLRSTLDACRAESENRNQNPPAVNENRPITSPRGPAPGQGPPQATSGCTSSEAASTSVSRKVRVVCCFGGQLLPRQNDGKLEYVGRSIRIIAINCNTSFEEFKTQTTSVCNIPHTIKYIIPGEDLDDLLTVANEEDLRTMIERAVQLEGSGTDKLKIYLLSSADDAILNQDPKDDDPTTDPDIQFPTEIDE